MVAQISMDALAAAQGAAIRRGDEGYRSGTPIRYLRSLFSYEDERCCCLFEADSAPAVRQVNDYAGLPYNRIAEAIDLPAPG
jgi:hypothetical protein